MDINELVPDARSGTDSRNLQEILDAAVSDKAALNVGQQQYQTPEWLAKSLALLLPNASPRSIYDPQCASGQLLRAFESWRAYGTEIDNRMNTAEALAVKRVTGNCVRFWQVYKEVFGDDDIMKFQCIVANPPFGIRWKTGDGSIDSTEWTWKLIKERVVEYGFGFFIANAKTIERMKIHEDPWVYLYQRFPAGGIWENCNVELGVVHYQAIPSHDTPHKRVDHVWDHLPTAWEISGLGATLNLRKPYVLDPYFDHQWDTMAKIMTEERSSHSKWNIFLNKEGFIRTYLSTRVSMKVSREDVQKLARINGKHPLTLTTQREDRRVMQEFLDRGIYTIQPEARQAMADALAEVEKLSCPIRTPNDFSLVAYLEEDDSMECIALDPTGRIKLTVGKRYAHTTANYGTVHEFTKKVLHTDDETGETSLREHDIVRHGQDRYVQFCDDRGHLHRFMAEPRKGCENYEHPESLLWQLFKKPFIASVKETQAELYQRNLTVMAMNEQLIGFKYFPGQLDYYARMACKDFGIVGADVGTGKTLGALTLHAIKSPKRTLIIAPQGTMRSSGDDEDAEDYNPSQWVQEIMRFAPTEPCFQLFCEDDWKAILHANGGELPPGIYITYPQAYFMNGAFEWIPDTWSEASTEEKFCKKKRLPYKDDRLPADFYSQGVGRSTKETGIRCIADPSLHTRMEAKHGSDLWEMVILDEAHLICNLDSHITKNVIRLQPKFRFAMTATPIPNIVTNIFSIMGWLCVPGWYRGGIRNAAWPYATQDIGHFESTFLSTEVDKTAQLIARAKGKRNAACAKRSPIISNPARLLKLLAPNMAYISKEDCNPNLQPCSVQDVRVKMGKEQAKLYAFWLNRANYLSEFKSMLTIAMVQSSRLRGVCASPASLDYTRGMCNSNFNPKTITILGLIRDCLRRGEQVVVVSARVGQSQELAERLGEASIPISRIDSTVAAELHTAEANRFKKGDSRVMLMGIKCAQGHSFDQCPNLIIGSLEWSYGTLHQAKGRVWRLTSPKAVRVWCVLHENTIEELLYDRVGTKQDAATICLRGQRVPREFKTFDPGEVLAEHIVNYDEKKSTAISEVECEAQWPDLCRQLATALEARGEVKVA